MNEAKTAGPPNFISTSILMLLEIIKSLKMLLEK